MKKKKKVIKCDWCIKNIKKNVVKTFFVENLMNSNVVFSLSKLTIVEELLIARISVLMSYSRVKNVQYKYFDHIINFMQNTFKVVVKLSSLFRELQILHLKFFSVDLKNSVVQREYDRKFNVKRDYVEIWFRYFIVHHSNYVNMIIDVDKLSQLSKNDFILNDVRSMTLKSLKKKVSFSQDVEHDALIDDLCDVCIDERIKKDFENEFFDSQFDVVLIEEFCVLDFEIIEIEFQTLQNALKCQTDKKKKEMNFNVVVFFSMFTMRDISLFEFDFFLHIECKIFFIFFSRRLIVFIESRQRHVEFDQ